MAAEAEAMREARAMVSGHGLCVSTKKCLHSSRLTYCLVQVVAAEGEHKASRALKEAADVIGESPGAMQLRYLQTLNTISAEKNSTIIFPIPIDFLSALMKTHL